ncbi:MAG: thiopeptide-type bacteriocin biosynthesis protein, partial [Pseudonocardiaceae bacterium]
ALLTHLSGGEPSPVVLTALSLFDVAAAFLGDRDQAAAWLGAPAPKATPDRADVEQVTRLARGGLWHDIPEWPDIANAHQQRADAIAQYRRALPEPANTDAALHSLFHMHHNRALGVDRDREAVCLRLARQAAATWRVCHQGRA